MSFAESPGSPPECDSRISGSDRESECDNESEYDSAESGDAYLLNCVSDSDDMVGTSYTVNPVLMNDIHLLKKTFPQSNCNYRCLDCLNEMDLDISFPTTMLEKHIADAWGLIYGEPVVIHLSLNQRSYLDVEGVKIEVTQKGCTTGVLMQLRRIAEEFCKKQFQSLSNEIVQAAVDSSSTDICVCCEVAAAESTTNDAVQNTPLLPEDAKKIPDLGNGFLVQLYLYIERRLLTLNSFCPVCDICHSNFVCMMLKPVVCSNPLCTFAYHALGVMSGAADTTVSEPQVVNLLIYFTKAAVKSVRNKIIFEPYPTIVHPTNADKLAIHPGEKDYKYLGEILDKMPTVQEMLKYNDGELKEILKEKHELCYPLLRWIISSNRSHIVRLPADKQLTFMGTTHQYLMRNSPPLQDRQFRQNKDKFGSVFAFHGSPIENWHSIIREGLVVASNTRKQLHGCIKGRGIYLSPKLQVSLSYSGLSVKVVPVEEPRQLRQRKDASVEFIGGLPESLACIALCEVIACDSLKKYDDIWTCDQSDFVCTRFFFV
ncbi:unnamed protein product, partial [Candidula unifasciata]